MIGAYFYKNIKLANMRNHSHTSYKDEIANTVCHDMPEDKM